MATRLLTRSDLDGLLDPAQAISALREAFVAHSTKREVDALRIPVPLPAAEAPEGASGMVLAPGLIAGIPAYSIKVHAKFPGRSPAIRGALLLHDMRTGALLAILESSYLTALRTGLAGALAVDVMARDDARTVAIVGAGAQGRSQLSAIRLMRGITHVRIFDPSSEAVSTFVADGCCADLETHRAATLEEALNGADIVVTATWAREPFLTLRHLRPGLHITTLGPDQPGKCEVAADALKAARVIVDDRRLALDMGAVGGAGLGVEAIHAELGEVLAGDRVGREGPDDVTIFGSVGLAFQDLAVGWLAYSIASERGIGRTIDLLG